KGARTARLDAEPQDGDGERRDWQSDQGNKSRQSGVSSRQDRHHSRAGRQDVVQDRFSRRQRARARRQHREGEAVGREGEVPQKRHAVVDDGSGDTNRHHAYRCGGEALIGLRAQGLGLRAVSRGTNRNSKWPLAERTKKSSFRNWKLRSREPKARFSSTTRD